VRVVLEEKEEEEEEEIKPPALAANYNYSNELYFTMLLFPSFCFISICLI
jgi:hypothetical protein